MEKVEEVLDRIKPVDGSFYEKAQGRLDSLTKPKRSLGKLEDLARRYAAIKEDLSPGIENKAIYIFACDHGVSQEGVSLYPKEVTAQMVYNFLEGGAAINVLARHVGAKITVVDMGVDHVFKPAQGLLIRKVARGTKNIAVGPAMTREEASQAVMVGIGLAEESRGLDIVGLGDMGIANTTPSSAIFAVISGEPVHKVTGRGTGLDDAMLRRKVGVIERAIEVNRPVREDPLDVLSKLGGFEIAGIAGMIIGASSRRIPVVIDGFISTAGAMIAAEMKPIIRDYLFAAHCSAETGHSLMLQKMGLDPILDLSMRLGEGTGAALGISLIEAGVKILREMATFEEAGVSGEKSK